MTKYPYRGHLLLFTMLLVPALFGGCVLSDTLQTFVADLILELVRAM